MRKSFFLLSALLAISSPALAEPQTVELCIKPRYEYKWGMPAFLPAFYGTHNQFNQLTGVEILPAGNYVMFDYGDEDMEDIKMLRMNGALTSSYQEGEANMVIVGWWPKNYPIKFAVNSFAISIFAADNCASSARQYSYTDSVACHASQVLIEAKII